jgi:hypothetical protein
MSETRVSDLSLEAFRESIELAPEGVETPSMRLTRDGWIFRVDGKEVKLLGDPFSLEGEKELADLLGVTPAEAWKIKNMALKNYWPKDLNELRAMFPGIVGEDLNIQLIILSLFSTKLKNPESRIMGVIVESSNSAGKSHLVKEILKPLRPLENGQLILEFSRLTGPYLERKFKDADLDGHILYIQELSSNPSQLHIMLSEGKLRIGITERENGRFVPIEYEVNGTPFLIVTSVNWRWQDYPDLAHRCVLINLDESASQTFRIIDHHMEIESNYVYKRRFEEFKAGCSKLFRMLWEKTPRFDDVIIPFLPIIVERLKTINEPDTKLRRDFRKLTSLIKASAIIFWPYRIMLKENAGNINERLLLVADFQDLLNVLPLVESSFQQIITNLSEKERLILELMKEQDEWTYVELAKVSKISSSTLRHRIIPNLEAKGYVIVDREGRAHRIMLAKSPESLNMDISDMREKALKMTQDAMALLLLSGCQIAKSEISPNRPLIQKKEPEDLAFQQNAKSPSLSGENKPNSSPSTIWHTGTNDKGGEANSSYINVSGGDGLEGG